MSPSSSRSDAFGFLVARGPVAAATTGRAWLQAMLDAEAALAGAQADTGEIPRPTADAIAAACRVDRFDVDAVLADAALGGNAVIPLVAGLRQLLGPAVAPAVHLHATSQDIADAATALVVRRSAELVGDGLRAAAARVAGIAAEHGASPMIARTLGQHAVPSTFGAVSARWSAGLAAATAAIDGAARTPVMLGGPSGDGTSFGANGEAIVGSFARRLGLPAATSAGPTQRSASAAVAGAWGLAAAAVGKIGLDIVLLAQSDIGEVGERADGAGGSSSMAHKHNPIAAVSARAASMQAPGLVSTLLHAAGGHELERASGAWHAEWPALDQLLRVTGSAVDWLQTSLGRLVVDPDRMAANLARRDG
ncbi:MAG: lyase family protein [Ilumatobacteraceae bacterium]